MEYANNTSNLLIDDYPIIFQPKLGAFVGNDEAIVFQQIHFWIGVNKRQKINFHDGRTWVYNSYEKWQEQLEGCMSERTIRRIIKEFENKGFLIADNFNKMKMDKTKWYSIDYDKFYRAYQEHLQSLLETKNVVPSGQNGHMRHINVSEPQAGEKPRHDASGQSGQSMRPNWPHPSGQVDQTNTRDYQRALTEIKRDDDDTRTRETSIQEPNPEEPKESLVSDSDRQKLNCRNYFLENIGPLKPKDERELDGWVDDMGEDMVMEAIFRGIFKGAREYSYIKSIFQNWIMDDIKTVDEVKADDKEHNRNYKYRNDAPAPASKPASTQNNRPQQSWNNYGKQPKKEVTPDWATDETAEAKLRQETPPADAELARQVAERIAKCKSTGKSDEDLAKMAR